MSNLDKAIRNVRFNFITSDELKLTFETPTGMLISLVPLNVSLNGIGAESESELPDIEVSGLLDDSIVFNARLKIREEMCDLGRLVLRRSLKNENLKSFLAFSTIDSRLPVEGVLSKYIDKNVADRKSSYEFELSPSKFNVGSFEDQDLENIDLFHRARQFEIYFDDWIKTNKYQHYNIRQPSFGTRVNLAKTRKSKRNDYLVMGSNDYLGLTTHPKVIEAAKKALDDYGFGSTGSPMTTGLTALHEELADLVARTFKQESAILFNSGYAANVGAISGLTREKDLILADFYCHASLQDGFKMTRAESRLFKHNDMGHLADLLKKHRNSFASCLIVTEGIFSMDGDSPPIEEITELAKKYNSRIFLDEAHSFGVTGPTGLGCWETCPDKKIDIIMGTFSKICGGIGGFVAADKEVIKWLVWHARSYIFSVSIPPSTAAAAITALKIFKDTPELLASLKRNIRHFASGLKDMGFPISEDHESSVVPLIIRNEEKLGMMNEIFRNEGLYAVPIVYPAVSRKNCRFRFTVMANHTASDIDFSLGVIAQAMKFANFENEMRV